METDTEVKEKTGATVGLDKTGIDQLKAENERAMSDFISVLPMDPLEMARKVNWASQWRNGCGEIWCGRNEGRSWCVLVE